MRSIAYLLVCLFFVSSCCKEAPSGGGGIPNPFDQINEWNELPHTLSIASNIADSTQTKGLDFYNKTDGAFDVVFRSIGVIDSLKNNTKLWVQILNPQMQMFAGSNIDSFFRDTLVIGSTQSIEIHNRPNGKNFVQLDTALLALPFSYNELSSHRPSLVTNTIVTVHTKYVGFLSGTNVPYDIERGALKRKNHDYIGFKNHSDGKIFFVELEGKYTLKSISVTQ